MRGTLHRGEGAESLSFYLSNWFIVLFLTNQVWAFVIDSSERASQVCQVPYAQGGGFPGDHFYAKLQNCIWPKLEAAAFPGAELIDLAEI